MVFTIVIWSPEQVPFLACLSSISGQPHPERGKGQKGSVRKRRGMCKWP